MYTTVGAVVLSYLLHGLDMHLGKLNTSGLPEKVKLNTFPDIINPSCVFFTVVEVQNEQLSI